MVVFVVRTLVLLVLLDWLDWLDWFHNSPYYIHGACQADTHVRLRVLCRLVSVQKLLNSAYDPLAMLACQPVVVPFQDFRLSPVNQFVSGGIQSANSVVMRWVYQVSALLPSLIRETVRAYKSHVLSLLGFELFHNLGNAGVKRRPCFPRSQSGWQWQS
jgi:hypothetical protein